MEPVSGSIQLHNGEEFVTDVPRDAFLVRSGEADIYVAPWLDERAGRHILLCHAQQGTVIPSFVYRDRNFKHWRFVIAARGETELKRMPGTVTTVLLQRFSERAGLKDYQEEGFENSIVDHYEREVLKDNVFIVRGKQQGSKDKSASYAAIKSAFTEDTHIGGDNTAYRAVAYASARMGTGVTDYEKVCSTCKERMDVPGIAEAFGLICREVVLENDWYRNDCGVIIGLIDKQEVVCVPHGRKYRLYFPQEEKYTVLTRAVAASIDPKAYCLERTLPAGALKRKDLIRFAGKDISKTDVAAVVVLGLVGILIGILLPTLNQKIYDDYIPLGNFNELFQICAVIGSFMVGNLFFSIVKSLCEFRIQSRVGYRIQDAAYYRLFRLPEYFFHGYDSADLAQRLMTIGPTVNKYISTFVITGISTAFSLLYLVRMFLYSHKLTMISILMEVIFVAMLFPIAVREIRFEKRGEQERGSSSSKLYQYLNGIEKIRMAGVEDRAIYEYMVPYSAVQTAEMRKNRLSAGIEVLTGISATVFSMVLYYMVVRSKINISMGCFVGFNTAMGTFTGSVQRLVENMIGIMQLRPVRERFMPIFETACEDTADSEMIGELSGSIRVDHVTFSYNKDQRPVLQDFSLHVKKGEYLGIVGSSGCGKSTLLKLLLGFEVPDSGSISYDGHDLRSLNKQALRRNLGVVLQNGRLIAGSIYENITLTAPNATTADVQRVLEAVGLKEDVAQMPMGVHTVLSENSGTISGGQLQRILIARAIINEPRVLFFDEATSALDNITQAAVCSSLDKMHATRIVVAHRLSTIRTCDRIIVMKDGSIVEEGNYDSLMRDKGLFYQLAKRQIAE